MLGALFSSAFGTGPDSGYGKLASRARQDAKTASDLAAFKGYGVTGGFGTAGIDEDTREATYTLDPTLSAFRDQLYGLADQGIGGINMDTAAAAQNYYDQQQGLMAGGRGAEDIALRNQQLQSGRIGLGLSGASQGAGAGTGYVNPEQYQRDLARSQVDAQMAFDSQGRARQELDQDIARSMGLFAGGTGIEQLGYDQLGLSADISNMAAGAGANQGRLLLDGLMRAQSAQAAGNVATNKFYTGLGDSIGGMFKF